MAASGRPAEAVTLSGGEGRAFGWIYFGSDESLRAEWREAAGEETVAIGSRLDEIAHRMRRPALNLRGRIASRNERLRFHSSHAFDLNAMVSPLFLDLCRLELVRELTREYDPLLVVSERPELRAALEESAGGALEAVEVRERSFASTVRRTGSLLAHGGRRLGSLLKGLFLSAVCWIVARLLPDAIGDRPSAPLTVLRTWARPSDFEGGSFEDRYLPGLRGRLTDRGEHVKVWLSVPSGSVYDHVGVVRRAAGRSDFVTPWSGVSLGDVAWALRRWAGQSKMDPGPDDWRGWHVAPLLRAEKRRFCQRAASLPFLLETRAWSTFRRRGVRVERLILPFENMFTEKPVVLGLKQNFDGATVVGFQHSALFPHQLVLYRAADQDWGAEMPDRIVASGRLFADRLREEGYPGGRVREGPALRFDRNPAAPVNEYGANGSFRLLVALPLADRVARHLWRTLAEAMAGESEEIGVSVKPHPFSPPDLVTELRDERELSAAGLEVVRGDIAGLLDSHDVLVATASSVLLDAVLSGTPVVRVKHPERLNFDPLDWIDEAGPISFEVFSSEQLRSALRDLAGRDDLREKGEEVAASVSESLFSVPADDVGVFL